MMTLLSMILSLALMIVGAPGGELSGPVSKALTVKNITVTLDKETISLQPTAALAVQTDGESAALDFHIADRDGAERLPFQAVVNAERLLLATPAGTLKLTAEVLQQMTGGALPEDPGMGEALSRYYAAYGALMAKLQDPEWMTALRATGDRLMDEILDRGQGTPEKLVYEGASYEVTSYDYDITPAQLAALTEALYASDDVMSRYAQAYFDLLTAMPQDEAHPDVPDSWQALYERMGMKMHMAESLSGSGFRIQDAVVTITPEGLEKPLTMNVHSVRNGDVEESTVSSEFEIPEMNLELYAEQNRDGTDLQGSFTLTGNPPANKGAAGERPEEGGQPTTGPEPEGDSDGEGDDEDLLYCTVDYSFTADGTVIEVNADQAGGTHGGVSFERQTNSAGTFGNRITFTRRGNDHDFSLRFDIEESDATPEIRASDEGALPLEEMDFAALMTRIGEDIAALNADPDVQRAMEMYQVVSEMPAAEEIAAGGERFRGAQAEFTWLPDGYALSEQYTEETDSASYTFANSENGATIYVLLDDTYSGAQVSHYTLGADGAIARIEQLPVTCEDYGDYVIYSADDGAVTYTLYPEGESLSPEDAVRLIAGIRFPG